MKAASVCVQIPQPGQKAHLWRQFTYIWKWGLELKLDTDYVKVIFTRIAADVQNGQVAQVIYIFRNFVKSVVADVQHAQIREHHFGFPSQNIWIGGILQNLISKS